MQGVEGNIFNILHKYRPDMTNNHFLFTLMTADMIKVTNTSPLILEIFSDFGRIKPLIMRKQSALIITNIGLLLGICGNI